MQTSKRLRLRNPGEYEEKKKRKIGIDRFSSITGTLLGEHKERWGKLEYIISQILTVHFQERHSFEHQVLQPADAYHPNFFISNSKKFLEHGLFLF